MVALAYAFAASVFLTSLPVSAFESGPEYAVGCIDHASGSDKNPHSGHSDASCCLIHTHLSPFTHAPADELTLVNWGIGRSTSLLLAADHRPNATSGLNFQPRAPPPLSV